MERDLFDEVCRYWCHPYVGAVGASKALLQKLFYDAFVNGPGDLCDSFGINCDGAVP